MPTIFNVVVEEDLDTAARNAILAEMEEIVGKQGLSLDDSYTEVE